MGREAKLSSVRNELLSRLTSFGETMSRNERQMKVVVRISSRLDS